MDSKLYYGRTSGEFQRLLVLSLGIGVWFSYGALDRVDQINKRFANMGHCAIRETQSGLETLKTNECIRLRFASLPILNLDSDRIGAQLL